MADNYPLSNARDVLLSLSTIVTIASGSGSPTFDPELVDSCTLKYSSLSRALSLRSITLTVMLETVSLNVKISSRGL